MAISIPAGLGAILTYLEAYKRVQADVDKVYKDAGLLTDGDGEPCFHDAEAVLSLSAVVRESMRLHTSITYQLLRVAPPQGVKLGDVHIPASAYCGISPALINRNRQIFGGDALGWVPERCCCQRRKAKPK